VWINFRLVYGTTHFGYIIAEQLDVVNTPHVAYLETYWDPDPKLGKTGYSLFAFFQRTLLQIFPPKLFCIAFQLLIEPTPPTFNMAIRGVNYRQTPIFTCFTCKTYSYYSIQKQNYIWSEKYPVDLF
jgi:hypothetical protein